MRRNTKGFTLIELLAVIVILAIIALIATPIVLNLINKAREGAAKDSAYGVKKAAELYYADSLITDPTSFEAIDFTCNGTKCFATVGTGDDEKEVTLSIDGTIPKAGTVSIDKEGKVTYSADFEINGYILTYDANTKQFSTTAK